VPSRKLWATVATALALAAIVAWSFRERWSVLGASEFPLGVDGYYYPIQLRALLEHGHLEYAALPVAFWWMAPFAALTDPITGAKLGAALGGALVALPAYGLGARLGRGRGPGVVAAALAACSASSTYLSIEFAKQGIALTIALAALLAVLRALEHRTRGRIAVAVPAVAAACLAHKLAAMVVVICAIPMVVEDVRERAGLRGRVVWVVLGGVACAAWGITLLLIKTANPFTTDLRFDLPALARPELYLGHDTLIGAVVALAAIWVLVQVPADRPRRELALAWTSIALALALALPCLAVDDPQGLAFRLRASAFVPLALVAPIAAGAAARSWLTTTLFDIRVRNVVVAIVNATLAAVIVLLPRARHEGEVLAHPALVASAIALADHLPAGKTVIVPERHVEYMIAWYTRAPVSARPEPIPRTERVRVLLPLSPVAIPFPLEPAIVAARHEPLLDPPIGLHPHHRDGFVLVTEPTWEWILAQLPARSRRHWEAWPTI
jgi:hypothetical protein